MRTKLLERPGKTRSGAFIAETDPYSVISSPVVCPSQGAWLGATTRTRAFVDPQRPCPSRPFQCYMHGVIIVLVFAFTSFGAQYAFDWRLLRPPPMVLHHTMILNFRCNWLL